MAAILLVLGTGYFGQSMLLDAWESFKISQSRTLPYISGTFVGRETALNNVLQLLDFDQSDTRVVSIDGPPGFGKSTLAIKVGHQMVCKGTNVLYVNMLEVSTMQVLAEKVCKGADIVIRKVVKIERMFRWARDLNYNTLLILDNCDDILQTHKDDFQRVIQTIVEKSPFIKVLMTSRHKAALLDDSYRYTIDELSHHSACQLLETTVKGIKLDPDARGAIANLTGNVPLALRVIGSLLNQPVPPSPETIIKELTQKPIQALSPKELPQHHQVNATIFLSYKYLHQYDKLCGQCLAYFPGSFDQDAASHIMQMQAKEMQYFPIDYSDLCLSQLVQQSLLGYNQRTEHFEFHRLIKEFFHFRSRLEGNSDGMQHMFNVSFQSHFAQRLSDLAIQFSHSQKSALGALDTEKHNIKYFLEGAMYHLEPSNLVTVISALVPGLEKNFLECRFSMKELHNVTKSVTNFLQHHYEHIPDLNASTHFNIFVKLMRHWAFFEKELESISSGLHVLTFHEKHIEYLYAKAEKNMAAAQYIVFYSRLSNYYEDVGLHHEVIRCQEKILEATDSLKNCQPGLCDYVDIGVSYLLAGDNRQGVKYLELAMQQQSRMRDKLQRARCLTWLHDGYTRIEATAEAEQVVDEVIALLPAVLQYNVTTQNKYQFEGLISFYLKVGKSQEAGVLQEKILQFLMELHETKDPRTVQYATKLAVFLYSVRNYSKAAEIGQITIERLKSHGLERDLETARMLVLVGKSKLLTWNISGLSYFDDAINLIEEINSTSPVAQEILAEACIFRMWRVDVKCMRIVSYFLLNLLDKKFEVSPNHLKEASPPKNTSTELLVYSESALSVVRVIQLQMLQIPGSLQPILSQLFNVLLGVYYFTLKFGLIPFAVFFYTCWPCLACSCSVIQCCCCRFFINVLRSNNWVENCILLLTLLMTIYFPRLSILLQILLVAYFYSFQCYSIIFATVSLFILLLSLGMT